MSEVLSDAAALSAVSPAPGGLLMRGLALGRAVIEADSFGPVRSLV
jgi:hypothetical protein